MATEAHVKKRDLTVSGMIFSAVLLAMLEFVIPDRVLNIAVVVVAALLLIGLMLVIYGTVVRNRWGINFQAVDCPRCHAPVPGVRQPKSRREMLFGGGTCDKCGCEMDKWGNPITT